MSAIEHWDKTHRDDGEHATFLPSFSRTTVLTTALACLGTACGGGGSSTTATSDSGSDAGAPYVSGDGECDSQLGEEGWPDCPGTYMFHCQNDGSVNYHTDFANVQKHDDPYQGCAEVDLSDPTEGDPPAWQDLARDACTGHCQSISSYGFECDPENWTSVAYAYKCTSPTALMDLGPVLALLGQAAATAAALLPCDLGDDCSNLLDLPANEAMWTPPNRAVRYTADIRTEATSATMQLLGGPSEDLVGQAAYTPTSCGAAACPFYLAQLELGLISATTVALSVDQTSVIKTLDRLSIRLDEPALGMWLPGTGDVIFPPNSLRMRVGVTVSGLPNIVGENGAHDEIYQLEEYVFGELDGNQLTISASGTDLLGSWSVAAEFEPPPPQ